MRQKGTDTHLSLLEQLLCQGHGWVRGRGAEDDRGEVRGPGEGDIQAGVQSSAITRTKIKKLY